MATGTTDIDNEPTQFSFPMLAKLACLGAFAGGMVVFALTFIGGAEFAFSGWTVAAWYSLGFPLFAMIFLSMNHLASAGWYVTVKRVLEAMTRYFPVAAVTIAILMLALLTDFYEWHSYEHHGDLHSVLLEGKEPYLNAGFFLVRSVVYFALWIGLSWLMVHFSRKQDADGAHKWTFHSRKLGAIFSIAFALTLTFASIDYLMSLEATWYSTMFGVYQFSGMMSSGFAMLILLLLFLKRTGYLKNAVNENHFHTLGIWLISACTFWAYIWFCQFMLIWYTNIPEASQHFFARWDSPWFLITFGLNPLLSWVIPFLFLLPRPNKRNLKILGGISLVVLAGRFVDLWQFVGPRPRMDEHHMIEATQGLETVVFIGPVIGVLGLFAFITLWALEKAPLLAKKDPYFEESVHHHL
jgi:hypothetical protein